MRGFLLLSVVGAILYGLLLVTGNDVPNHKTEDAGARSTQHYRPERTLRSWGTNLPALATQKPSVDWSRPVEQAAVGEDPFSVSEKKSTVDGAKQEQISTKPPSRTQAAIDSAGDELSKPKSTKPVVPRPKQRSRSAKPAPHLADKFITRSELQRGRWARRDDRRRRSGLFGRRFAKFDSSW